MFICDECLEKNHQNDAGLLPRSRGPCEDCGQTKDCIDIHHSWLKPKLKPKPKPPSVIAVRTMRTKAEIQRAIDHLKEALSGAYSELDPTGRNQMIHATTSTKGLIKALEWVLGSDVPGDFGDMLKELDQVGEPRKPS